MATDCCYWAGRGRRFDLAPIAAAWQTRLAAPRRQRAPGERQLRKEKVKLGS